MDRRKFLMAMPIIAATPLLSECRNLENASNDVEKRQAELFRNYNSGAFYDCMKFFHQKCTFTTNNTSGDRVKLEKNLKSLYNFHEKLSILPIEIRNLQSVKLPSVIWITGVIFKKAERHPKGTVTQIFVKENTGWLIIHQHLSHSMTIQKRTII